MIKLYKNTTQLLNIKIKYYFLYLIFLKFLFFFIFFTLFILSGTGSYPPGTKGLHLKIRFNASQLPRKAPKRSTASIAYCEQLGENLQHGAVSGDMRFL